uniref:Uncharacterized protein n=1 Tax=Siphoviridae sp. ctRuT6 TaxID=2826339 RepID=A0A8S5N3P2_9CAUD|nr:MAG TPA: hypothetical protein [Siphoviridae sp. ctRuT6]
MKGGDIMLLVRVIIEVVIVTTLLLSLSERHDNKK